MDFRIDEENTTILTVLAALTGRKDKAEVIRDALSTYHMLAQRKMRGETIFVCKNDKMVELRITTLEKIGKLE